MKHTIVIRAVVMKIESIFEAKGVAVKTHFDPRFVVHVHVVNGRGQFETGTEHALAVHSIAQTFGSRDDAVGATFELHLTRDAAAWTLARPKRIDSASS